ncbi:hypothetical protein [Chelatococcus reniformis]|uniref:Uncharacterized protein n=1 Tax=Chelatococcus reniformis TaxID=1494448 RepID=A0A916UDF1_9HYPH|nr:hypothetical protein [Chelatococcus reniformis]GGC68705.1 hypothetical protein GCM10010994_29100 [Chelatococcus reniformis]
MHDRGDKWVWIAIVAAAVLAAASIYLALMVTAFSGERYPARPLDNRPEPAGQVRLAIVVPVDGATRD